MASFDDERWKGFASLVAVVAIFSMATATLRLLAHTWARGRLNAASPAAASPAAASAIGPTDPPSPAAAAAMAKGFVERSLRAPAAKFLEPVIAERIGGGNPADGVELPRYLAKVVVDVGASIRSRYLVTLRYAGDNEWEMENMEVATKFSPSAPVGIQDRFGTRLPLPSSGAKPSAQKLRASGEHEGPVS